MPQLWKVDAIKAGPRSPSRRHLLRKECGGWCPKGRKAEDGCVAAKFPLIETPSASYKQHSRVRIAPIRAYRVLEKILEYIKIGNQDRQAGRSTLPHWR
jgi:putative molybdenum carrier protein